MGVLRIRKSYLENASTLLSVKQEQKWISFKEIARKRIVEEIIEYWDARKYKSVLE